MANTKSAKKRAKQSIVKRNRNLARRSALKTAIKRVLEAVEIEKDQAKARDLLRVAEAQIARAKGKGLMHRNTASRKVSKIARAVSAMGRAA